MVWTEHLTEAFNAVKNSLAGATLLAHPVKGARLEVVTDASANEIGAVLQQVVSDQVQPLAFFSLKTTAEEGRYSTYDLELLSIHSAIVHFRHMLEGIEFTIYTDQKLLTSAFFKVKDPLSNRQRNQISFISEFCTDIAHVLGCENVVADALSRQFDNAPAAIVNMIAHRLADIDLYQLAADQQAEGNDKFNNTSLKLRKLQFPGNHRGAVVRRVTGDAQGPRTAVLETVSLLSSSWPGPHIREDYPGIAFTILRLARNQERCKELGSSLHSVRRE